MTDHKKPETISEADLDSAQGAMPSFGAEASTFKRPGGSKLGNFEIQDLVKQPTSRMEEEMPDE
ncbi:MAG: hypothetical protein AAGH68_02080 [Pseudomonadota bacterium]